ncbi:iron dependent repressor, metal binding and dimerization domain protein [Geoglobus acetivorans]|uniref:Metal-dependent transcriptional regulator n=1 Tax=Geoglobus acetivorans TaxID=565033 RepID=A0ABZ3H063_GEOAI|nr:metal-dependent transcriptional regulator [Geoglobus acetivorans]
MERIEEYLETIYDIQKSGRVAKTKEIAERLNIKPSSVTEMLNKLSEMGYVDYQPYKGATLTRKGLDVAERIKKNYMVFKKFFTDFFGLDDETAHGLSCTLEHIASEDVIDRICRVISGYCDVCDICIESTCTLEEAGNGRYVVIVAPLFMEKAGIYPGKEVEVKNGLLVVDTDELMVDDGVKKLILLRPL